MSLKPKFDRSKLALSFDFTALNKNKNKNEFIIQDFTFI